MHLPDDESVTQMTKRASGELTDASQDDQLLYNVCVGESKSPVVLRLVCFGLVWWDGGAWRGPVSVTWGCLDCPTVGKYPVLSSPIPMRHATAFHVVKIK
jgi:hypothetical protein